MATSQIAPVAGGTDAVAGFARNRRTHLQVVYGESLQLVHPGLVQQCSDGNLDLVAPRGIDVLGHHAAQHALAQRLDHVAALDEAGHGDAIGGAAISVGDHQVLGHVHQTPRQITGVGGLERGIGQTLARTVRGDEILQHGETFAEVRGDGRFARPNRPS